MDFTALFDYFQLQCPKEFSATPSYCIDSREVTKGSVFFALPGEKVDGHTFLPDVAKKGASLAIVNTSFQGEEPLMCLRVPSVPEALQQLAKQKAAMRKGQTIAITGSLGKTTTKEFTATLLSSQYTVEKTPRSCNSQLGLPLSILNMNPDVDFWVLEMGMSAKGHIARLVELAPPDIAALIHVDHVHSVGLENSLEEIARAKSEIFQSPKTKKVLLCDPLPKIPELLAQKNKDFFTFSLANPKADFFLETIEEGLSIHHKGETYPFPWTLPGAHNKKNFLAACSLALLCSVPFSKLQKAVSKLKLPARRLEFSSSGGITFVNDSYNACVSSIKEAFSALPARKKSARRFMVFGEMVELGELAESSHRKVGLNSLGVIDEMLCLGDGCKPALEERARAKEKGQLFLAKEEIASYLLRSLHPGDLVLFKGANKHALWELVELLQQKVGAGT